VLRKADVTPILMLAAVLAAWAIVAFAFGLDHTPDSGLYLYSAARGFLTSVLSSTQSNYAPGFPWLTSAALRVLHVPGDAATLVQTLALLCILLGSYTALRAAGSARLLAFCGALLVGFFPSTSYVLGIQLSEGPLCGAYLLLVVLWCAWKKTNGRRWLWLLMAVASATPFLKYASAIVPPVVAVCATWHFSAGSARWRRLLILAAAATIGLVPIAAYFTWNRLREGVLTSHPAARVGVFDNLQTVAATLLDICLSWPAAFVVLATAIVVIARLKSPTERNGTDVDTSFISIVIAVSYFASIIAGASVVAVDPLSVRLCAPGIALAILSLALAATAALRVLAPEPDRLRRPLTFALALAALLAVLPGMRESMAQPLRMLLQRKTTHVKSAYQAGFRRSASATKLHEFYTAELTDRADLSLTVIEATRALGRMRNAWMMVAGVLGNSPRQLGDLGSLRLTEVVEGSTRFRVGNDRALILLDADIPPSRGVAAVSADDVPVLEFLLGTLQRVVAAARARGRHEHWLLVPKLATWFRLPAILPPEVFLLREADLGSYRAYLLQL
jgi:hypothetical protein